MGHMFILFFENRQSSFPSKLRMQVRLNELSPVEHFPFPSSSQFAAKTTRLLDYTPPPGFTRPLRDPSSSTRTTGVLPDIQTGALPTPFARNTTTAFRQPIVIRATSKTKSAGIRPPTGRRWQI